MSWFRPEKRVRIIAAIDRRGALPAIDRLRSRRDVDLEVVAGAARAAASAWQRRPALVIFQVSGRDDGGAAGAGALDAVKALRSEPTSAALPVLVVVPSGRVDLRAAGFAAGASEVCFAGEDDSAFEEALLHLAGLPMRRHRRRAASIAARVLPPDESAAAPSRAATALNLSPGGVQIRWEGDVPPPAPGEVLRVELGTPPLTLFAAVQGGTRLGSGSVTRLRFVGVTPAERAKLDALVESLPGPDEAEPEPTPMPLDDDEPSVPEGALSRRAITAAVIVAVLLLAAVAAASIHLATTRPLSEPTDSP